ncbi:hypothetical protein [Halomonas sp. Cn5-12]|jgi:peptide subunit release factor 1 (eRF1)|uniref:hypothetical protein n=1 Tax=Halomonas sp. Cn5-12 TaxID=2908885 RepID=UPI001F40415F|nr:hypothetical protein [Halomonas sp. Cn5-12]MCF2913277.1 hypothetical protein [Halomonas sp. Cn5-12]MCF2913278.1 hypothetical protein [Halomonas sp. Cn5-12]
MSADVVEKAEKILSNNEHLREFAALNEMTTEAAKALLERLMREPVVSEKVEEFVFSEDASPDLKGYYSGEEKGYSRGHEAGFAKGAAVGVLATLATVVVGGATLYLKFKD